ncbi:L-ribulose-5-phosphate 4-epimerase AraD [Thalassospira lucentensis]|uniref:L-ribulose-5-phosphate 4-epimerase AraD n=1 Tax=Thalassospira lucentensis TaxID=168935 RepID=UPI0020CA60A6|nr:L-ribulose-5-phosphate 4-epimerase AraD [Thalassospira lucentensis]
MTTMNLDTLKANVLNANLATVRHGLVKATFGNASGIDRESGLLAIKPSGVPYDDMTADHMVVCDLDGRSQTNLYRPSSDLETHLALYRAFDGVGAIIHTHSTYATIMAQACQPIIPLGTTHADYFHGTIPVTRHLTPEEIKTRYVAATGDVIVESVAGRDPLEIPAALVAGHGPFVWGDTLESAVLNAMILEEVAKMAWHTLTISPSASPISQELLDRHYLRKHGENATYGQN